jgi:hypothetical protein
MGRNPIGDVAMSNAERSRRKRQKASQARDARNGADGTQPKPPAARAPTKAAAAVPPPRGDRSMRPPNGAPAPPPATPAERVAETATLWLMGDADAAAARIMEIVPAERAVAIAAGLHRRRAWLGGIAPAKAPPDLGADEPDAVAGRIHATVPPAQSERIAVLLRNRLVAAGSWPRRLPPILW